MIVGTKTDCRTDEAVLRKLSEENQKPITTEEGEKLAKETKSICYMECSALTRTGLNQVFDEAIHFVLGGGKKPQNKGKCSML